MISQAWILVFLALSFRYTLGDNVRPVAHCIDDETSCTRGCQPGYRGSFCNETCSEHCGGACSQDTGHCLTGCKPNWFTSTCSQPCSGNCVDDVCDSRSAECIRGCKDGIYGLNCNETCSGNCTEGKCDIYGGCHCKKGVLDKFCYIDCTDNCIGGMCAVDNDGQLKCLKGCKEGRMGAFCNEWCPYECPDCDSTCVSRVMKRRLRRDSQNNCRENSTCQDGYRGRDCHISCQACRYKANCSLYCAGGSWGEECHLPCPQNCSRAELNDKSLCDHEEGYCSSGCLQGYFGYDCKRRCDDRCLKSLCFINNGSCTEGCFRGYWGKHCEDMCSRNCINITCQRNGSCDCKEGYYGPKCEAKCSDRCKGNCSIAINGSHICEKECVTGFTGVDCLSECPSDCRSSGCSQQHGTCTGPPETPLDFKVINSTMDSVTLTWTPQDTGGDFTQTFHVEYRKNKSADWSSSVFPLSQNNTGFGVVDGLDSNTEYVFRIKSVTDMKIGTYQSPVSKEIYVPTKDSQKSTVQSNNGAIIGGTIGSIVFIIIVVVICVRRKRNMEAKKLAEEKRKSERGPDNCITAVPDTEPHQSHRPDVGSEASPLIPRHSDPSVSLRPKIPPNTALGPV